MQADALGYGKDGDRWRDNQGDVWEWNVDHWHCGRFVLCPTDDQDEFAPFTDITDRPVISSHQEMT